MAELGEFQRGFARALLSPPASDGVALTIHRNTVTRGLVDALAANYPTIAQLVGREWFDACAVEYVRAHPARSPALVRYGESFPGFLATFEPAMALLYLSEVARIDRLWIEAHTARDAQPLMGNTLARLNPEALFAQRISLHPATRFGWFPHSAATIWLHHRSDYAGAELEISGHEEGLLLTRPVGAVDAVLLDRVAYTFLDKLFATATLGEAATAALEIDAHIDIAGLLARFITAGAFAVSGDS